MSNIRNRTKIGPQQRKQQQKDSTRRSEYISKLSVGLHRFRVLPGKEGEASWYVKVFQHWVTLPGGKRRPINCASLMVNQPCPLCSLVSRLESSNDEGHRKAAYDMRVGEVVFANVIDRSFPEEGVKVWQIRPGIFRDIVALDQMRAIDDPEFDFTDPDVGRDITVLRTGTGKEDTQYKVSFSDPSPLAETDEQMNVWWDKAKPLSKNYTEVLSPAKITAMLKGEDAKPTTTTYDVMQSALPSADVSDDEFSAEDTGAF